MRWNDSITFVRVVGRQDEEGAWHEDSREEREVFCNSYNVGTITMATLNQTGVRPTYGSRSQGTDVGLRAERQVQVRAIDYEDEELAIYHGREYKVLYCTGTGELRLLTLARRLGNE